MKHNPNKYTFGSILTCKWKLFFLFLLLTIPYLNAKVYYVKEGGMGGGTSWNDASGNVQDMLDKASSGDQVWIAKGKYYPTTESIVKQKRSKTFLIRVGTSVYGGFEGFETQLKERSMSDLNKNGLIDSFEWNNKTILSGDIDGKKDIWSKEVNQNSKTWHWKTIGNDSNAYHVVTLNAIQPSQNALKSSISPTILDGLFIEGGNADGNAIDGGSRMMNGGGIYSTSNKFPAIIRNCSISNCSATGNGGAISTFNPSTFIRNCAISDCHSNSNGGGIYSHSTIKNCNINNCSADENGGGAFCAPSSLISNCLISNCSALANGGGITTIATGTAISTILNCTINNCSADVNGGGIFTNTIYSCSTIKNTIVAQCIARNNGGGIFCTSSNSAVINCSLSNNNSVKGASNIEGHHLLNVITPNIATVCIKPTTFGGVALSKNQEDELYKANWQLKDGSPCIDAGTSDGIPNIITNGKDILGKSRISQNRIDIGAYEYHP